MTGIEEEEEWARGKPGGVREHLADVRALWKSLIPSALCPPVSQNGPRSLYIPKAGHWRTLVWRNGSSRKRTRNHNTVGFPKQQQEQKYKINPWTVFTHAYNHHLFSVPLFNMNGMCLWAISSTHFFKSWENFPLFSTLSSGSVQFPPPFPYPASSSTSCFLSPGIS